jgi:hypothetical protein
MAVCHPERSEGPAVLCNGTNPLACAANYTPDVFHAVLAAIFSFFFVSNKICL